MFRRLLVPIFGNAATSVAVGFAIEIAKARDGDITFCYALDAGSLGLGDAVDASWTELLRPDAEKIGNAALARATAAGCRATLELRDGVAEDVIVERGPAFDLVIMGTRAAQGVLRALDHSVTDAVVRRSRPPVLVVRDWDTAPEVTPANVIFERFLIPVDGTAASAGAVRVASTLASERHENLLFVYVLDRSRAAAFSGSFAFDSGGAFEVMRRFGADVLAKAEATAKAAGASNVTTKLLEGEALDAILGAITTEHADAVIIGTHGRRGIDRTVHGSVTEDLIRRSPVPILALHAAT